MKFLISYLYKNGIIKRRSATARDLIQKGNAARDRRDWKTAIGFYCHVIEADPTDTPIRVQLGHAYKETGEFELAAEQYQAALLSNPEDDDLHLQIGHLCKVAGNLQKAYWHYARACVLNPKNENAQAERLALAHIPVSAELPAIGFEAVPAASMRQVIQANDAWAQRIAGDQARDARLWQKASVAYRAYLDRVADDGAIWVQFGHALKELGDLTGAEAAYRTSLALLPGDADVNLQLGHVLKLAGQTGAAILAYHRSFELAPTLAVARELEALGRSLDFSLEAATVPDREPMLFLEISDLFSALLDSPTISGIQRVQLNVIAFALRTGKPDAPRCRFVIWHRDLLWVLAEGMLQALLDLYDRTGGDKFRSRRDLAERTIDSGVLLRPVAGDIVLSTGTIYRRLDVTIGHERLKWAGVRIGAYIHDFIPLTHPEACDRGQIDAFSSTMMDALLHLDFALTVSEHVAGELRRLLQEGDYPPIPVQMVPEAHSFGLARNSAEDCWTTATMGLHGIEFVLCVGTISVHKNQILLLQIWQLLLREGVRPPVLVLAGQRGHACQDLFAQLETTRFLGGHVRVLENLNDADIDILYRNCLFTMFPSITAGWGLPVGESLAQGKLCIASSAASMPDVGDEFVLYIDPYDARAAAKTVAGLIADRAELARLEQHIRTAFRPRSWDEHGEALLAAAQALGRAESGHGSRQEPLRLLPGRLVRSVHPPQGFHRWHDGTHLPPLSVAADLVRRRVVLAQGWHPPESWGTWMDGASGLIRFRTDARNGEPVRVLLQFRPTWWVRGNRLEVIAECGARIIAPVPESDGPDARWPLFLVRLDCIAGDDGAVTLRVRVLGRIVMRQGEPRQICVGLTSLIYLPIDIHSDRLSPNRLVSAACPLDWYGNPIVPRGEASLIVAAKRRGMLGDGWREPETWGCWMDGSRARIDFPIAADPGSVARLVLNLRMPLGQRVHAVFVSACGARTETQALETDPRDLRVWLDCRIGEQRSIGVDIEIFEVPGSNVDPRGPRLGLVGLVWGRAGSTEDRLALSEALLFPASVGADSEVWQAVEAGLRFTIVGHMNGSYSLAAVNRRLALALEEIVPGSVRVLQVEGNLVDDLTAVPVAERKRIAPLAQHRLHDDGPEVVISQHWPTWVPHHPGDLLVAWFAWEEGVVPLDIVRVLNSRFRAVVVQTRFVRKALIDSGVRVPVRLMGCASDLADYAMIAERRAGQLPRRDVGPATPFTFLHVSSCFPRKGVDALLAAYAKAFRRTDPVRLVIKGFPNPHNDVAEQIARLRAIDPAAPAIEFVNSDLPPAAVARLYEDADAMVLPARGEGYNLVAAEALAAGLPLIVTGHGGHIDFATQAVARLVDYSFARSASHLKTPASVWADPNVDDLAAALREVFIGGSDVANRIECGREVARHLADSAGWARRVRAIAIELIGAVPVPPPAVAWVTTWGIRCGIATHSRYLLDAYPDAARHVTVLGDDRTPTEELATTTGPQVRVAWRAYDAASMDRLAETIDAIRARVVVVQHQPGLIAWPDLALLLLDGRLAKRKVIVVLHNVQEFGDPRDHDQVVAALSTAARLLVHCVRDLNTLKSYGLVDNVTVLPPGAIPPRGDRPPLRDLPTDAAPVIGCYGFVMAHKGIANLIEGFAGVCLRWPKARLRLVCAEFPADHSVAEIHRCRALADRLGIAERIEWCTDFLPDEGSLALLRGCDVLVLPYKETLEAASGAVRVAMASRVPVITSPIAIFDEAGDAVLRLPSGDPAGIADGIAKALEDRGLRQRTVEQAEKWLEAHDWARMSERMHGMMVGLLASDAENDPPGWLLPGIS